MSLGRDPLYCSMLEGMAAYYGSDEYKSYACIFDHPLIGQCLLSLSSGRLGLTSPLPDSLITPDLTLHPRSHDGHQSHQWGKEEHEGGWATRTQLLDHTEHSAGPGWPPLLGVQLILLLPTLYVWVVLHQWEEMQCWTVLGRHLLL